MAIQKKVSSLFANTGKGAVLTASNPNDIVESTEEDTTQEAELDVSATIGKVTARIPTSLPYSYIEVEITGNGAVELAAQLITQHGSGTHNLTGPASNFTQSGGTVNQSGSGETVMFNGVEVTIPEEYIEELEGATLQDNRGMGPTKTGKKRPDFVFQNGVNQLAGFINTTDFKGNKIAPKLSWGKLAPAYKPRG